MNRPLLVLLLVCSLACAVVEADVVSDTMATVEPDRLVEQPNLSEARGTGDKQDVVAYFTRTLSGQSMSVLNSFSNTSNHYSTLSLDSYHVSGWDLYQVDIAVNELIASPEKEVIGVIHETENFRVCEESGIFYSQLAQGFYNQPHDGVLVEYSVYYSTSLYNPTLRNNASLVIRSDYSSSSTDITQPVNMTASDAVKTWSTIQCQNETLSADTVYWAMIDGSDLIKAGGPPSYPYIYWGAEDNLGVFPSFWRGATAWDSKPVEALFNYTYIPWNTTEDSPLSYSSSQELSMTGNMSALSGVEFSFSSLRSNISHLEFRTNQSAYVDYNLTLSYKRGAKAATEWVVSDSGSPIQWNSTFNLDYPSVSGAVARYANISMADSWNTIGLYESGAPTTNKSDYVVDGRVVVCPGMYTGTWRLASKSRNQMTQLKMYNSSDNTEILDQAPIDLTLDVNLTLQEQDGDPITTGSTNLTITRKDLAVWKPSNVSVAAGHSTYEWDIDSTTGNNGLFLIEAFWTNGTDSGYLSRTITVIYPTSLKPDNTAIDAFTDDSFEISVYFEDSHTPQPLDGQSALLTYSFNGTNNVSMIDHNNGTWTATISTIGFSPGTYLVDVYAEGYALTNQSTLMTVKLIHDTEIDSVLWSPSNAISYVESTELIVTYQRTSGISIDNAIVNVTIGMDTWNLMYHSATATYRLLFNGSDLLPGFGVHSITIRAWKMGYEAQVDSSQTLTLTEESTSLDITWTDSNSITYVGNTDLVANYTMSNGSAIVGAMVTVTVDGTVLSLDWDEGTSTYRRTFRGDTAFPGLGESSISVHAELFGYVTRDSLPDTLTISEETTSLNVSWTSSSTITYVDSTILIIEYWMSNLTPIEGAVVNVTIGTMTWNLTWHSLSETYRYQFDGTDNPPGLGSHSLTILADRYGFVAQTAPVETLTINEEPTVFLVEWSTGYTITYVHQTTLSVTYQRSDTTPISTAAVNVTFDSTTWSLIYNPTTEKYEVTFSGWEAVPGIGVYSLTILANLYGFQEQSDTDQTLTITEEPTSLVIQWSSSNNITYIESTTLSANYSMSNGTAVKGANLVVTIDGNPFNLVWNAGSSMYEYTFDGSDDPPGLGIHMLAITGDKTGYQSQSDSLTMTLRIEPTLLQVGWVGPNVITYVGNATLVVDYTTSNGTSIEGATVTATIDTHLWTLVWNHASQDYRYTFLGSDSPPDLGVHSLNVECALFGYASNSSDAATLTINLEPTSLDIQWSNGYELDYFESTYLLVDYRMNDLTTIQGATVNVTIDGRTWQVRWNSSTGFYTIKFNGSDASPGVGRHSLTIRAGRFGFMGQTSSTEELILPEIPTTLTLIWVDTGTITYIESTILRASYTMYNGTAIEGAEVNANIDGTPWIMSWNAAEQQYEVTFYGNQDPPGFGTRSVTVLANKTDFVEASEDETLIIVRDPTSFSISWSDADRNITYHGSTILSVQYLSSAFQPIGGATLNATIGTDVWILEWNASSSAYETVFCGEDPRLGFTTFTVTIRASLYGYESRTDSSQDLTVRAEDSSIAYVWDPSSTITYVGSTVMNIHYLMSNGTPIREAVVNVTIGIEPWDAVWNESTKSYQVTFLGTDDPPNWGVHTLIVRASKANYESLLDYSQQLSIINEPTNIDVWWSNGNTITYVEQTTVWISYTASDGTTVLDAFIQIKTDAGQWTHPGGGVFYDSGTGLYFKTFSVSEDSLDLGTHNLTIEASRFGFDWALNDSLTLIIEEDSASITLSWLYGNNLTFIEHSYLIIHYRMSNAAEIQTALVNVSVGSQSWIASWNETEGAYTLLFTGADDPPGFGNFVVSVEATATYFESRSSLTELVLREDPTFLTPSWTSLSFDWTATVILSFDYRDSQGRLIPDALQKQVLIDGIEYGLFGANGTYYIALDNVFDLGLHCVETNISKFGYSNAYLDTVSFTIVLADTTLAIDWSSTNIDYLGQIDLTVLYECTSTLAVVPMGEVTANLTIDGEASIPLVQSGSSWILNLTGVFLDLGTHAITIRVGSYGYVQQETVDHLTILEVVTDALVVTWNPSNLTIEYFENISLSLEYTYYGGHVPEPAEVNVTIAGRTYELTYSIGMWHTTILGKELDLGLHTAYIVASAYGYENQSSTTLGINVTQARNRFDVFWEPPDLRPSCVDIINVSVIYRQDYEPIQDATVILTINGTDVRYLMYSSADEMWHLSIDASALGLGVWNMTVTANKTGYAEGIEVCMLSVERDALVAGPSWTSETTDYLTPIILQVQLNASNGMPVLDAMMEVTVDGITRIALHLGGGLYEVELGPLLEPTSHTVNVTASGSWFHPSKTYLNLEVVRAESTLTVQWSNTTIYYTQTATGNVFYEMLNGSLIVGTVSVTLNGTLLPITWVSNHWGFDIDGSSVGLGSFLCSVNASGYGFVSKTSEFVITVQATPTELILTNGPLQVPVNESLSVFFDYENTIDSSPISGAMTSVEWPTDYSVVDHGNGTYEIQLTTAGLAVDSYFLDVTLSLYGYETRQINLMIDVLTRLMRATYQDSLNQYENETLAVSIQVFDFISATPLEGADVVAGLDGTSYTPRYDDKSEAYIFEIWLGPSLSPGDYEIQVTVEADEYESLLLIMQLTVLEKETYIISLQVTEEVEVGGAMTATLVVSQDEVPVSGVSIRVILVVILRDGSSQTFIVSVMTDADGNAQVIFDLPSSAVSATVTAEFLGSTSAWPAESNAVRRDIRIPGTNILSFILSNPIALAAIGGITGVAAIVLIRKMRGSANVPGEKLPRGKDVVLAVELADSERVCKLITDSPDGLTRKEISEMTGLSSSKVGETVRNLFISDTGFYEWREGRSRLIRYRDDK